MRFRVVHEDVKGKDAKAWAVILQGPDGVQIEKREYKTREAAETAREKMFKDMRGES